MEAALLRQRSDSYSRRRRHNPAALLSNELNPVNAHTPLSRGPFRDGLSDLNERDERVTSIYLHEKNDRVRKT